MLLFKPLARIIIVIVLALVLTQGCVVTRGNAWRSHFKKRPSRRSRKARRRWPKYVSLLGAPDRLFRGNDREYFTTISTTRKCGKLASHLMNFIRMYIKSDNLFVIFNRKGSSRT